MSASRDHDARQDAMLRAFERLRSEITREGSSERTVARQLAFELVERALTTERTTLPGRPPPEARPILSTK